MLPLFLSSSRRSDGAWPARGWRRFVFTLLCAAAPLLLSQCRSPVPGVVVETDAQLSGSLDAFPSVRGRLDGHEAVVVLDTGAMCSGIDAGLAHRLGLPTRRYVFPRAIQLVGGKQHAREYAQVGTLDLGGMVIHTLELPLVDLQAGAGLTGGCVVVGCDVLRQCRILFERKSGSIYVLAAARPDGLQASLRELRPSVTWSPVTVHWDGNAPLIEVGRDGLPSAPILLDTGAMQSAFDTDLAKDWHLPMKDADGLVFVDGLRVGPWRARFVAMLLPSTDFRRLGFDVIGHMTFVWDGPGAKLWIADPPAGSSATFDAGWGIDSVLRSMGLEPVREDAQAHDAAPSPKDQ